MLFGFIHGVMNTDNTSIAGETIDYGPCAFMEAYEPSKVFSSIDQMGRYAFSNQPPAAQWNLIRLAESLLDLLEHEEGSKQSALISANEALAEFGPKFEGSRLAGFRRKLGLFTAHPGDAALVQSLLDCMAANRADFTLTFRQLSVGGAAQQTPFAGQTPFPGSPDFDSFVMAWRLRLKQETISEHERSSAMRKVNPIFIPRNHLVENVIDSAVSRQDFKPFEDLLGAVSQPYEDRPGLEQFSRPARPEECVSQTFCGT